VDDRCDEFEPSELGRDGMTLRVQETRAAPGPAGWARSARPGGGGTGAARRCPPGGLVACRTELRPGPEGGGGFAPAVTLKACLWHDGGGSGANRAASGPEGYPEILGQIGTGAAGQEGFSPRSAASFGNRICLPQQVRRRPTLGGRFVTMMRGAVGATFQTTGLIETLQCALPWGGSGAVGPAARRFDTTSLTLVGAWP
jgi:hypothetical protein